jgi:hypothetical protein
MPKKPVAVSLRKPQAPADVDGFVGGSAFQTANAAPRGPLESASDVQHGARDYREMTFYLPTSVARELSFYCLDRNCDANRIVADAVSAHVTGISAEPAGGAAVAAFGAKVDVLVGQARERFSALAARCAAELRRRRSSATSQSAG